MVTSSKLLPCLFNKSLKTQEKLKELETVLKCNLYLYFLIYQYLLIFGKKYADASKTQGLCHVIYIYFRSPLGKV